MPDRERADGHVSLTRPANVGGQLIHDVVLTFDRGLLTEISAPGGADALREFARRDEGTRRLGEIALVDGESAVAKTGQTFGVILLDENAASHIALGFGFPEQVDPADGHRVNQSGDHLDLMVGSDELEVTGLCPDGSEQLLLAGGRWVLG